MNYNNNNNSEKFSSGGESNLLFQEDMALNALFQVRVFYEEQDKIYKKPFQIYVSGNPQAPAGKGSKTYLVAQPYSISFSFDIDALDEMAHALEFIASGKAVQHGYGLVWDKWAMPSKYNPKMYRDYGTKNIKISASPHNKNKNELVINLAFSAQLPLNIKDERGVFKNAKRNNQYISHYVGITLSIYQALSLSNNLKSLVVKLREIDRNIGVRKVLANRALPTNNNQQNTNASQVRQNTNQPVNNNNQQNTYANQARQNTNQPVNTNQRSNNANPPRQNNNQPINNNQRTSNYNQQGQNNNQPPKSATRPNNNVNTQNNGQSAYYQPPNTHTAVGNNGSSMRTL